MGEKTTQLQEMLARLRTEILIMATTVGIALEEACAALEQGDAARAAAVVDGDATVNAMENEFDDMALSILACYQPVAYDLRFITGSMRMVTDLERIGDEAASIAERTITMEEALPKEVMDAAGELMRSSISLYKQSLAAFRLGDTKQALKLCRVDDEITQQEVAALHHIMEFFCVREERLSRYAGMNGILICRSLNRICRRCANIAEHTYFIAEGINIKHQLPLL